MAHLTGRALGRRVSAAAVTAVTTFTVAVVAATSAAPAGAAGAPAFLQPGELPPHAGSPWHAGPVTSGVPDPVPFCVGEALPGATSMFRQFWTDVDTNAQQVTVVERDEAAARRLAALLDRAVRQCPAKVQQQDPDVTAKWRDYGPVDAEEGARVHGVQTTHAQTGNDVHLFAVGRDGRTVTVVHWGEMGTFAHAPVTAFKKTTRTAVEKLY
ncbi:hypothetical protein [Streptomyces sp. URMC 124]|uniref:hypothetical protein n=1 Tax=Streptomyces sp. URMC 124 TaxID=3423405 RepID=UPI003F1AB881